MELLSKSTNAKRSSLFFIIFIILLLVILFLLFPNYFKIEYVNGIIDKFKKPRSDVLSVQEKPSVFEEAMKPIYGIPEKISIETLKINADIVSVGVDENGYLETPKGWNLAGWYQKGAKPAEIGNLLINAHFDDNYGRPAAFWMLKNIKVGDTVSVLDSYGRYFNYKVVNVYYIDINDPERAKVFEAFEKDKSVMTLITCGGVWVPGEETYSKRLVVNAELIQ